MTMATHDERFADLPNGTRLCWASHGDEAHPPVLLIAGLGLQLVYWPEALIRALTRGDHRVIVFDNRDAGRSTRAGTAPPSKWQQLLRAAPADAYALEDMAEDTALLMHHLGLDDAHVVGMSMGGMIGQALAAHHAPRVRSLTSIFSTTGHRRVGQPAPSTLWRLASARRPTSEQEAVLHGDDGTHRRPDRARGAPPLGRLRRARLASQRPALRRLGLRPADRRGDEVGRPHRGAARRARAHAGGAR
jgi:pimeloyl-ACP methyl ester carboxylesterase